MRFRKNVVVIMTVLSLLGGLVPHGFAQETWKANDPSTDEWMMLDIVVARPLGILAGLLGSGIFVLSLPFTIPTNGVDQAAKIFVIRPFKFSFTRPCPDEDM